MLLKLLTSFKVHLNYSVLFGSLEQKTPALNLQRHAIRSHPLSEQTEHNYGVPPVCHVELLEKKSGSQKKADTDHETFMPNVMNSTFVTFYAHHEMTSVLVKV